MLNESLSQSFMIFIMIIESGFAKKWYDIIRLLQYNAGNIETITIGLTVDITTCNAGSKTVQ